MKEKIIKDYIEGVSILKLSKKYNLSNYKLSKMLKESNINILSNKDRYSLANKNLFKNISSENDAYWIGMLYSDGNVYTKNGKNTISLSLKDKEHIEKFKLFININNKIYESNKVTSYGKSKSYSYSFSSKEVCDNLEKYGIVDNKSKKEFDLSKIDDNLHCYFWRGMIDGDGWIVNSNYLYRNKIRTQPRIGICGLYKTCLFFKEFLIKNKINIKADIIKHYSIFKITLNDKIAMDVLKLIYTNPNIYLDRKHKIVKQILNNESDNTL